MPSPMREVMLYILGGEKKTRGRGSSTCVAGSKSNCLGVWGATLFVCSHLPRTVHMHTTLDHLRFAHVRSTKRRPDTSPFAFHFFEKGARARLAMASPCPWLVPPTAPRRAPGHTCANPTTPSTKASERCTTCWTGSTGVPSRDDLLLSTSIPDSVSRSTCALPVCASHTQSCLPAQPARFHVVLVLWPQS